MLKNYLANCGESCKFSPFDPNILAVTTSKTFGIVGPGKIFILNYDSDPLHSNFQGSDNQYSIRNVITFQTKDIALDCAWSEGTDSVIIAALGDGTIPIFKIDRLNPTPIVTPTQHSTHEFKAHLREVSSLNWNIFQKNCFLSSSWDMSLKLWDVQQLSCISSLEKAHAAPIGEAIFSPLQPNIIASVGGDLRLNIFDVRIFKFSSSTENFFLSSSDVTSSLSLSTTIKPLLGCIAHQKKVLSLDWNKYNPFELVTGATDGTIRLWDIRKLNSANQSAYPLSNYQAHQMAVRKTKFHPFRNHVVASCSFDMNIKIWDTNRFENLSKFGQFNILNNYDHHTEFVMGLDWNLFQKDIICSTSWDRTVSIWNAR